MEYILPALLGLLSGAVGSLIAPWIHWSIEKRKLNRIRKEELLNFIREFVLNTDPREIKFLNSSKYIEIRKYLSEEFVKKLENKSVTEFTTNEYRSTYQNQFLAEVDRIEKDWGLQLSEKKIKTTTFQKTNSEDSINLTVSEGNYKTY